MKYSGSCLCKKHLFEITGTITHFFLCHCAYCKKDTGTGNAANLFFTNAQLTWKTTENECRRTYTLSNSRHQKSFCIICGSALPIEQNDGMVVAPAGSLDTSISHKPDARIFGKSINQWELQKNIQIFDSLPT
jgi:hypothetical protein